MRVSINERCQGHARCIAFAPHAFEIDEEGFAHVRDGFAELAEVDPAIVQAADNCPEQAIDVEGA